MQTHLHPYFKVRSALVPHVAGTGPWAATDLCKAYQWPNGAPGGSVIAIVELSGGWTAADVQAYASKYGLPAPDITDVSVDGTTNAPGGDADGEVALDIQLAWASYFVATGKAPTIRMYWAQDIASAVRAAYKDGCDVCSISWGADEANWGLTGAEDMNNAAGEALAAGMVVFAASGDNDSSDGGPGAANVDCPASCPNVIACGGTCKTASSETVWNNEPGSATGSGTGGGFSTFFTMPAWQASGSAPVAIGRMVPDVAGDADPNTGYEIVVGGQWQVVGGTSAVAPLYAGLFASFGTKLGAVGAKLWANRGCFSDITQGNNGQYAACVGPDPCTGLGAPIGAKIEGLFTSGTVVVPAPSGSPSNAPTLAQTIEWACSQLPSLFMTDGMAKKHIAAGLTKNWPKP